MEIYLILFILEIHLLLQAHRKISVWVNGQGDSGTELFTFTGNFVYLRAVVTREHIEPYPDDHSGYGQVDKVLLSL